MDIVNAIGKFVYVNPQCLGAREMYICWILIEKDYSGGFPDHIEIYWEDMHVYQKFNF